MTVYNSFNNEEQNCKYQLRATVTESNKSPRSDEINQSFLLEICTRSNDTLDAPMTIVDITLLTGFRADEEDLKGLRDGVDKYINNYQTKTTANNGSVVIYLDKVPHEKEMCFGFRIHQILEVGLIQPASITVYEYYDIGNRCTKFYHLTKETGLLDKICKGEICVCAEDNCFQKKTDQNSITFQERIDGACAFGRDFVYIAEVNNHQRIQSYDYYNMTIVRVVKEGSDENVLNKMRHFVSHMQCLSESNGLIQGNQYLIMGKYSDLWKLDKEITTYLLSKTTWIEWRPTQEECRQAENQQLCSNIANFVDDFAASGCRT
ncbi:complement C3-like [Protopterus annectens]|uniref:complement C3-like n=1 Tax=Protopterus annectens TaxID=7888 RepID=UPI001CFA6E92|nr:complement C3-like [Protopterus annectens]